MKLMNKVALITGGNSGIGLATAREFKANGAKVTIFGRNRETLDQAAASLGDDVLAIQGDVRNFADIDRLFEQSDQRFGKIDVLVSAAGIAKFAPIASLPETLFDELCDIHFKGTFFTVQRALPYLRDGASVILVSSCRCRQAGASWNVDLRGLPRLPCGRWRAFDGGRTVAQDESASTHSAPAASTRPSYPARAGRLA